MGKGGYWFSMNKSACFRTSVFSEFSFLHAFSELMYFLSFRLAENMALILEMVAYQYHVLPYVVSRQIWYAMMKSWRSTPTSLYFVHLLAFLAIIDGAAEEAFSVIIYVRLINSIAEQNFQKDYFDWLKYGHIYRVLSFLLLLHLTTCEAGAEPMCFSRKRPRHINSTPTHLLLALNEEGKTTLSLKARDTQTGNWVWERWLSPWRTP